VPDKCNQETAKEQRIEGLGAAVQRSLQLQQEKDHEAFLQQEVDIELNAGDLPPHRCGG